MKNYFTVVPVALVLGTTAFAQESELGETHLNALDKDGDASISLEEFQAFSDFAFEQIDVNKDGSLSRPEVETHADVSSFGLADTDGNGAISAAEFKARMQANFEAADQDGDGQLN